MRAGWQRTHRMLVAGVFVAPAMALALSCHAAAASGSCVDDPWQCGARTTCWPKACLCPSGAGVCDASNCTPQFDCVPSRGGQAGDACELTIGQATCLDGMTCVIAGGQTSGQCRPYCDPAGGRHGCEAGYMCARLSVGNASSVTESVCVPVPIASDASLGVDASPGGDDGGAVAPMPEGGACNGSSFSCAGCVDACAGGFCVPAGACCSCQ